MGPQLRMAVALLYSAMVTGNASRAEIAVSILDDWVAMAGPGFTHAVWDTAASGGEGAWIDDGPGGAVFLRRAIESHRHALEAAEIADAALTGPSVGALRSVLRAGEAAAVWRAWAFSLADVLLELQVLCERCA